MKTNTLNFLAGFWTIALGIALPFTTSASEIRQWTIESGGNGHFYEAISETNGISWQQASNTAVALGGYLATPTSAAENDFIYNLASADDRLWHTDSAGHGIGPWIGGFQRPGSPEPGGGWGWVTGEPFAFTAWATFEPTDGGGIEDRISYFCIDGLKANTWNDYPGDPAYFDRPPVLGYIVEWDSIDDTDAPQFKYLAATRKTLWPPNHRLIPVEIVAVVKDNRDPAPSWQVIAVYNSEPQASGNAVDCKVTGRHTVVLRAERLNPYRPRVYQIVVQARDATGNATFKTVSVTVSPWSK